MGYPSIDQLLERADSSWGEKYYVDGIQDIDDVEPDEGFHEDDEWLIVSDVENMDEYIDQLIG